MSKTPKEQFNALKETIAALPDDQATGTGWRDNSDPFRQRRQQQGRHLMAHDESPTWCIRCGQFDCYLDDRCSPVPASRRWWRKRVGQRLTEESDICRQDKQSAVG